MSDDYNEDGRIYDVWTFNDDVGLIHLKGTAYISKAVSACMDFHGSYITKRGADGLRPEILTHDECAQILHKFVDPWIERAKSLEDSSDSR